MHRDKSLDWSKSYSILLIIGVILIFSSIFLKNSAISDVSGYSASLSTFEDESWKAHSSDITVMTSSPTLLVTGDSNGTIKVWENLLTTPTLSVNLSLGNSSVRCLTFSQDYTMLAAAGEKGKVVVWSTEDWKKVDSIIHKVIDENEAIISIGFTHDGLIFLIASNKGKIEVFDTNSWNIIEWREYSRSFKLFDFSPVTSHIAIVYNESIPEQPYFCVEFSSISDSQFYRDIRPDNPVLSMTFSPKGDFLAIGTSGTDLIEIWDINNWELEITLNERAVNLAFSSNSEYLLASQDGKLMMWSLENDLLIFEHLYSEIVSSITISPKDSFLAFSHDEGTVKLRKNPLKDSDADGLIDFFEEYLGTDPLKSDSDGDGLSDFDEFHAGLDPNNSDSDGDGSPDGEEYGQFLLDPLNPSLNPANRALVFSGLIFVLICFGGILAYYTVFSRPDHDELARLRAGFPDSLTWQKAREQEIEYYVIFHYLEDRGWTIAELIDSWEMTLAQAQKACTDDVHQIQELELIKLKGSLIEMERVTFLWMRISFVERSSLAGSLDRLILISFHSMANDSLIELGKRYFGD